MSSRTLARVSFVLLAVLASCAPSVNYTPISPAATPTANVTPGPLSATPGSLTFNSVGLTQTVSVTDPGYSGAYTISGCAGVATFGTVTSGSLNVTAVAAGSCALTVSDTLSHATVIPVGVTSLSVPVL
jgi:hypothetical protein